MATTTSKNLIYALVDPRSKQWRYIGKSCSGLHRPGEHVRPVFLRPRTRKNQWLRGLLALGLAPEIEVLEELPAPERLSEVEREWIAAARAAGCLLTNETDGGDGLWGRRHTTETRLKMSCSRGGLDATQRDRAVALYKAGRSLRSVATEFNTGSKVILRVLTLAGVRARSRSEAQKLAFSEGRR